MPKKTRFLRTNAARKGSGVEECSTAGKTSVRQCAFSLESHDKDTLIRFVRTPKGVAVPDVTAKLPGRGIWLKPCRQVLEKGLAANLFSHAFKMNTVSANNLCDEVERQLVDRCIKLLGLARKSGLMVKGFEKVRARVQLRRPAWLLEASGGARHGRTKICLLTRSLYRNFEMAGALTSSELGMVFGGGHVVHALLEPGPLADSFGITYRRLIGFRPAPEKNWFLDKSENHYVTNGPVLPFRTSGEQRQV